MGLAIVVERPVMPATRVVTCFAPVAQSRFMLVVLFMAGVTLDGCILEFFCYVTFFAFDPGVLAQQRKDYDTVVKARAGPTRLVVTHLAIRTFLPFVNIIRLVAGDASCLQLLLVQHPGMAGGARDFSMGAAQRVPGQAIVIKQVDAPVFGRVTGFAFTTESAAMFVITSMTGDAGLGRIFMIRGLVAGVTLNVAMLAY